MANRKTERRADFVVNFPGELRRRKENIKISQEICYKLQRNVINYLFTHFGFGGLKILVNTV